jgi:predicted nucleotidyltransferase
MENEDIVKYKIQKAIDFVYPLYWIDLIDNAFIVGSVAKGTARKESDIDIIIVNPILHNAEDLSPTPTVLPYIQNKEEEATESLRSQIVDTLKSFGVEFKEIYKKDMSLWYQFYDGEIFHIMTRKDIKFLTYDFKEFIEIKKEL